ncbi:proton-coupled zinc antiporter SLC30A2 [Patella vulgata]|uniref:proton-coupled zinc antiporter SLC30A2 n=1 Tax=Patella vulgata TaxID=6465 RepID=UPI00217FC073|nr:proton-coupled zinc antiporter SLC30A2 [Patella vulgata]
MSSEETFHCHSKEKTGNKKVAKSKLLIVLCLCLLFMVVEAIGGVLSNSLALFTDVLHLGSDLISFLISLLAIYLSQKPPSRTMSFGYHRAEVVGALFSVLFIWMVSGILCYIATLRIIHEDYKDVKADEMLITAGLGVVFNLIMAGVLHINVKHSHFGHNHSHSPGDSHSHTPFKEYSHASYGTNNESDATYEPMEESPPSTENINVRAAFIHCVGDIIQSLGVFIAALIIKLTTEPEYRLADPICTFIFSIIVLFTTINIARDGIRVILEAVPHGISFESIKSELESIRGVKMVHSLYIWPLTVGRNAVTVHLAKDSEFDNPDIMETATRKLKSEFNFSYITVQVENYNFEIMSKCTDCKEI